MVKNEYFRNFILFASSNGGIWPISPYNTKGLERRPYQVPSWETVLSHGIVCMDSSVRALVWSGILNQDLKLKWTYLKILQNIRLIKVKITFIILTRIMYFLDMN